MVFLDVLHHQSSHPRHLGSGHRGAGHEGIFVSGSAFPLAAADGVDVAAGGSDLRLKAQITGNAPGGERTHGEIVGIQVFRCAILAHGNGASVIGETLCRLCRCACRFHRSAAGLADGCTGHLLAVAGEIHAEHAGHIVVNHQGRSPQVGGYCSFIGKIGFSPGTEDNLPGQIHAGVVLFFAQTVNEQVRVFRSASVGVQGRKCIPVVIHINHFLLAQLQIAANAAVIVHGSYGKCVGICSRGAGGAQVHILGIQVACTCAGRFCPVSCVAGGSC